MLSAIAWTVLEARARSGKVADWHALNLICSSTNESVRMSNDAFYIADEFCRRNGHFLQLPMQIEYLRDVTSVH